MPRGAIPLVTAEPLSLGPPPSGVPNEMMDFGRLAGFQPLIIRGPPGAGKTTLVLTFADAWEGPVVYVSTRVSKDELLAEFPHLRFVGGRDISIIDGREFETSIESGSKAVEELSKTVVDSHESQSLRDFMHLPGPVQEAVSRLVPGQRAMVIIDAWEPLLDQFLGPVGSNRKAGVDRAEVERLLLKMFSRENIVLCMVLERADPSSLDYLVNGVVIADREDNGSQLMRWILFPKFRNVAIRNGRYPFTLHGKRVQAIVPFRPSRHQEGQVRPDPEPSEVAGMLWPGSTSFADAFGRLPLGKFSVLAIDPQVPEEVVSLILDPMMIHTMQTGGRVAYVPFPLRSPLEVWHAHHRFLKLPEYKQRMRIIRSKLNPNHVGEIADVVQVVRESDKELAPSEVASLILGFVVAKEASRTRNLAILSNIALAGIVRQTGLTSLSHAALPTILQDAIEGLPVHVVITLRASDTETGEGVLRSSAALDLRVDYLHGRIVLRGVRPSTGNYFLKPRQGDLAVELLPIV